jgi:hypothetical protein
LARFLLASRQRHLAGVFLATYRSAEVSQQNIGDLRLGVLLCRVRIQAAILRDSADPHWPVHRSRCDLQNNNEIAHEKTGRKVSADARSFCLTFQIITQVLARLSRVVPVVRAAESKPRSYSTGLTCNHRCLPVELNPTRTVPLSESVVSQLALRLM